ncbi:MAG: hypothetical protein DDT39_01598 [Firmicutes bacterium]|nr:hypothetical protein [candidate division NPL-UPA2 bacterium]
MTKKQLMEQINAREAARRTAKIEYEAEINATEAEYEVAYDAAIEARKAAVDVAFEIRKTRISKARAEYNAKIGAIK